MVRKCWWQYCFSLADFSQRVVPADVIVPRAYAESIATSVRYACGYGSPADTNQSNVHCVALMMLIRIMNAVQK